MIRVTEPLNYFKEPWYIDWVHRVGRTEANKTAKKAMSIGSRVDELIKNRVNGEFTGKTKKDSQEVLNCCQAFKKWEEVYKPTSIVPCERYFASIEGEEISGEPDIMVDGVLVDIKCSAKISPSYWLQVNMYRYLQWLTPPGFKLTEDNRYKVGILRLDKVTASYEYVVKEYDPSLVNVWLSLMRAYVYFNKEKFDGDEL